MSIFKSKKEKDPGPVITLKFKHFQGTYEINNNQDKFKFK